MKLKLKQQLVHVLTILALLCGVFIDFGGSHHDDDAQRVSAQVRDSSLTGIYTEDFSNHLNQATASQAVWDSTRKHLRLDVVGNKNSSGPMFASAADSSGGVAYYWPIDQQGGQQFQKLSKDGDPVLLTDKQLHYHFPPSYSWVSNQADIHAFADGRLIIARYSTGIEIKTLTSDGTVLSTFNPTNFPSSNDFDMEPDHAGNVVVASLVGSDIYSQKLDSVGNVLWSANVQVNSPAITTTKKYLKLAIGPDNQILLTWQGDQGGDSDIYAQKLTPAGNKVWSEEIKVNSNTDSSQQRSPDIVIDSTGIASIVWEDTRLGLSNIFAQRLAANGSRLWMTDTLITANQSTMTHTHPSVAVNPAGELAVVWQSDRPGNRDIYAQVIQTNGTRSWASARLVNSSVPGEFGYQNMPDVVVATTGHMVVSWQDQGIFASKLDFAGNTIWSDHRVQAGTGAVPQGTAVVATSAPNDEILAAWSDGHIYAQLFNRTGSSLWQNYLRVSDELRPTQSLPVVADVGDGSFIFMWCDDRDGISKPFVQKVDLQGNRLLITDKRISPSEGCSKPKLVVDADKNIWAGWYISPALHLQKLSPAGDLLLSSEAMINWPMDVYEIESNGDVVAAVERQGPRTIFVQRFDSQGHALWLEDKPITHDPIKAYFATDLRIAIDTNGMIFVSFNDAYASRDRRLQQIDAQGNMLGMPTSIGYVCNSCPAVIGSLIANRDGGVTSATEFWQGYMDFRLIKTANISGSLSYESPTQISSQTQGDQREPVLAVDSHNRLIMAWTDYRNPTTDIYLQAFDNAGKRTWPDGLPLLNPELFYNITGTVESKGISVITNTVRQATLTADYQTNGGEVKFFLSNDGGTTWITSTPGIATVFPFAGSDLRWRAELDIDSVWSRTPVVTSIRIEHSALINIGDTYESDDSCANATLMQANGAAQIRSFHQDGDADWVKVVLQASQKYVLVANALTGGALPKYTVHESCSGPPIGNPPPIFGDAAILPLTDAGYVPGTYWIKIENTTPHIFGSGVNYALSLRADSTDAAVVIVAGRNSSNVHQDVIERMADFAYDTFLRNGYTKDNIYFLSNSPRDADGNGVLDDIDASATVSNVRYAIQDWARPKVALGKPLWVYLVDHGQPDRFMVNGDEAGDGFSPEQLDLWLSNLEATSGLDQINVIIDACMSGSFIRLPGSISGTRRTIVTSANDTQFAWGVGDVMQFSHRFWSALRQKLSIRDAFLSAKTDLLYGQQPWLDDNGDGVANTISDGTNASARGLSGPTASNLQRPQLGWLDASAAGELRVSAQDDLAINRVVVEIVRPDSLPSTVSGQVAIAETDRVTLTRDVGLTWSGNYSQFNTSGVYRLVAYAWDGDGNTAQPVETTVTVGESSITVTPSTVLSITLTPTAPTSTQPTPRPVDVVTLTPTVTPKTLPPDVPSLRVFLPLLLR